MKNLGLDLVKYRWKIISDFLKENKDKYNLVFATDERDVVFQKDITYGTIISSVDKFIEFSDILQEMISDRSNIFDQDAINYLIYYKKILNDSVVIKNNHGSIMTICVTKRNKISLDADNNVLNFDGKIAAIVHQYDRKPDIVRKFNNEYNDALLNKYFTCGKIKEANKVNN